MKINDIYFGRIPVLRLVQNGIVIWERGVPIELSGFSYSISRAEGKYSYFVLLLMSGETEIGSYILANSRPMTAVLSCGDTELHFFSEANALAFHAGLMKSLAEHWSYAVASGLVPDAVLLNGHTEITTDAQGVGQAPSALPVGSEISSLFRTSGKGSAVFRKNPFGSDHINTYATGKGTASRRASIKGTEIIHTYDLGGVSVAELSEMFGLMPSKSYMTASMNMTGAKKAKGFSVSRSEIIARLEAHRASTLKGKAESVSHISGNVSAAKFVGAVGKSESRSNASANTRLIYLNYQKSDTLYIRSAHYSNFYDGVLYVECDRPDFGAKGKAESRSYLIAALGKLFEASLKSNAESHFSATGALTFKKELGLKGESTTRTNASAKLKVVYPNYQEGDTLYIRSAHRASLIGDVLQIEAFMTNGEAVSKFEATASMSASREQPITGEGTARNEAAASMSVIYLNDQTGDELYIRSAQNATVTDGTMSIT